MGSEMCIRDSVTAAAVFGALLGARLTAVVNPDSLRQAFGWFVLAMSAGILGQEIHPAVGVAWAGMTALAATLYLTCRVARFCPWRWLFGRRVRTAAAAA